MSAGAGFMLAEYINAEVCQLRGDDSIVVLLYRDFHAIAKLQYEYRVYYRAIPYNNRVKDQLVAENQNQVANQSES